MSLFLSNFSINIITLYNNVIYSNNIIRTCGRVRVVRKQPAELYARGFKSLRPLLSMDSNKKFRISLIILIDSRILNNAKNF